MAQRHVCEPTWWSRDTVAVVTGANKGLGLECARQLACEAGFLTVIAARNEKAGREAIKSLEQSSGGSARLDFHPLEVTDNKSIEAFKNWLQHKYGKLTVLINNAGIAYPGDIMGDTREHAFGPQEARHTLAVNLWGAADVTESLLPLMPTDGKGRVVMMGSRAGQVRILGSPQLQERFMNVSCRADLEQLMDEWVSSIEGGQSVEQGWPKSMYGASKLALNSYTRVKAKEVEQQRIAVNSCTPGYCSTDLTSGRGNKSAYEGVKIATWLATKPPDMFETGCFWALEEKVQKEHF